VTKFQRLHVCAFSISLRKNTSIYVVCNIVSNSHVIYIYHIYPKALVTMTVTRKFFSILVSIVRFGHEVYPWQFVGMSILFAGLLMNDTMSLNDKAPKAKKEWERGYRAAYLFVFCCCFFFCAVQMLLSIVLQYHLFYYLLKKKQNKRREGAQTSLRFQMFISI
jgi:hypothetical protein